MFAQVSSPTLARIESVLSDEARQLNANVLTPRRRVAQRCAAMIYVAARRRGFKKVISAKRARNDNSTFPPLNLKSGV